MLKIAITGNIASGKTTVQKLIEEFGYKMLDTDIVGHILLSDCPEVKYEFKDYDILDNKGEISREKLGKIVFSDEILKQKLENILHPLIRKSITEFFADNREEKIVFVGIPLLFEAEMQDMFDKIILVYTNDKIREKRLIDRNNYTEEYAKLRMNCQNSQDEKKDLVDFVLYNNGSLDDLKYSVRDLLSKLS